MAEDPNKEFSHFDADGNAIMVDVSKKVETERVATASGRISMSQEAYDLVKSGTMAKGDVLGVARIAGIMAAKKVDSLIPLCHPLAVTKISIDFSYDDDNNPELLARNALVAFLEQDESFENGRQFNFTFSALNLTALEQLQTIKSLGTPSLIRVREADAYLTFDENTTSQVEDLVVENSEVL